MTGSANGPCAYDMVIVGGGPGGYSAALYAARAGLSAVVLEQLSAGGQMAQTEQVENYPGFPEGIDGFDLGERMRRGAERFGAKTVLARVSALNLQARPKTIETAEGVFYGKTVVYAAGAGPRELGVPGEKALHGRGVSYCAACDGMFYRGKTVAVVGGGNSAASDALLLSRIAAKVILIHRRDALRAENILYKPLQEAKNVEFRWNCAVTGLLGEERLTGVRIRDAVSGEETVLPCHGLFVCIGRKPATDLVKNQLVLDDSGYILADETTRTNISGVFAVGDVRAKALRQILTAAADGAVAVHYAQEYLLELEEKQ